jgi:predicted nucleotidyltransferase
MGLEFWPSVPYHRSMKVSDDKLQAAVRVLRAMGARRVLLFGSAVETPETAHDIDLAVEGIPVRNILEADVAVCEVFEGPTDLVTREENPGFFELIERRCRVLYEQG